MHRMIRAFVFVVAITGLLPGLASPLHAQGAQVWMLRGRVVDAADGRPVAGASVRLIGTTRGTTSNADGYFEIPDIDGTFETPTEPRSTGPRVRIDRVGYEGVESPLEPGAAVPTRIALKAVAIPIEGVEVRSVLATEGRTSGAFTDLDRATIERDHYGQDLPMLLAGNVPGTYAYSDAGNGIGYSYLKIRGFGQRRIGVTINGIPLNDPQSREVYWIDHPDLATSAQSIQVQRGVGAAVYGTTALGGSVAVETIPFKNDRELVIEAGGGSFDTQRY